jgi:SAM-dependent methyltransferase
MEGSIMASADQLSRYRVERSKWDAHARRGLGPNALLPAGVTFESFVRVDPLLHGIPRFLGDLRGKRILEYGCGLGALTVLLAKSGARVTAFDLSEASVERAGERARLNGVLDRIEFHVAPGEALPFPDGSFDRVIGKAVLHHLDPVEGASELARVLTPGGRAAFSEPLGMNPLLVFARKHLPYPEKHVRGADRPLTHADIADWRRPFAEMRLEPRELFSMVERAVGRPVLPLRSVDAFLLSRFESLCPLCRYGLLFFTR